ncbi:MAG TPA: GntR family transcriptional regulator [Holophagaceae bacterium]|jgi:DNA-binding GntR family transcriptional regulator|nr:GntR family transcriptional regulator [Holophagaceae bacterium]
MKHTPDNQTLVPGIAEAIRDQICRGNLRAGEVLHQTDLARDLGVSPVPLREALRRLESEGLVTFLPYRGTIVTPVTASEVHEIHIASVALEVALLPYAIPRLTERDFQKLYELCEELALERATPERVAYFYQVLLSPAGMPTILQAVESLVWRSVRFFPLIQSVRHHSRDLHPTRREVVQACESGDVERAKRTLTEFLEVHTGALLEMMGRENRREIRGETLR